MDRALLAAPAGPSPGRHRIHLRDPRRDVLHRFETPSPQQDFLVELGGLVLGGDPVNLPCCESDGDGRRSRQNHGTAYKRALCLDAPTPAPRPSCRNPLPPRLLPVLTHPYPGAQGRWEPHRWSNGGSRKARRAAARPLEEPSGRRGCARGGDVGGSRRLRACCACFLAGRRWSSRSASSQHSCEAPRRSQGIPDAQLESLAHTNSAPGPRPRLATSDQCVTTLSADSPCKRSPGNGLLCLTLGRRESPSLETTPYSTF